jgi:branched-subunit amino acid transport protein
MRDGALVVLVLGAATYALKAAGPLVLGNRQLPDWLARVVALLPAPLLAALVVVSVAVDGGRLVLDARVVGVLAAGVVLARGGGFITTVLVAAVATAVVRALLGVL